MNIREQKTYLSIVIPVYNAENTIERLVTELVSELSNQYQLEIILVNDHSADQSETRCINLFEKYKKIVRFYSLSRNVGEHNAVMAGLNQVRGDYVIIMDDDLQNPVSEVTKIVEVAVAQGFDVVYSYYEHKKHSLFRNFGSWFNDQAANIFLGKPRDLYLCSFKVLNKFLVKEIIKYQSPFPYIDGLILQITDNVGKVKAVHQNREKGKSGYTLGKLISLWLSMSTNFSILPLRLSSILGFVFAGVGILLGIYTINEKITHPHLPLGYSATIVALSFFMGIQLLVVGTVGEYVGRIFMSINRKPQFTIKKRFELPEPGGEGGNG